MYSVFGLFHPVTNELKYLGTVQDGEDYYLQPGPVRLWWNTVSAKHGRPRVEILDKDVDRIEAYKRQLRFALAMGFELLSFEGERHARVLYPFRYMEVGDEYLVKLENTRTGALGVARKTGHRHGFKFSGRNVEGGLLVTRIA